MNSLVPVPSSSQPSIRMVPIEDIQLPGSNPRKHSKAQISRIANSIARFGFVVPLVVDEINRVIGGEARLAAARQLGFAEVPTIRVGEMSDADKTALRIALNRLAELSEWDDDLLRLEFEFLLGEPSFPVEITGFDMADIDALLAPADIAAAEEPPAPPVNPVSTVGDLWTIGRHRILCGDATDPAAMDCLMNGQKAAMVFTDPPYNVPISGHVSGLGAVTHREFVMASGEMSRPEFIGLLEKAFRCLVEATVNGAIHFVCMDWRHILEITTAGEAAYDELKNVIVWVKKSAGMGSFYRSQYELVFAFKSGTAPHINNFGLGSKRYRTNVWTYAGANSFRKGRAEDLAAHPTVKPIDMVAEPVNITLNIGKMNIKTGDED